MGGGSMWRGVARVVTPAVRVAAGSGSATASTSCSFCKTVSTASASAAKPQTARLRSCACNTPGSPNPKAAAATTSSLSQQGTTLWDLDEWEFAEEEEKIDHLVFGSLPSRTEIEEASSELQNALRLGLVAPAESDQAASRALSASLLGQTGPPGESSLTTMGGGEVIQASNSNNKLMPTQMAIDWVEPPPIRSSTGQQGILQAVGRRDNVVDAFRQFQHNPEVQSMVVSLAADPAVWDAVLANEKIQEFKRKLQKDKSIVLEGPKNTIFADVKDGKVKIEEVDDSPNIFMRWQSFWHKKWSLFVGVLSNINEGFFTVADRKVFAEEDGDIVDRTVKSCTMLAVLVLSVVILKRLAVQAA